MRTIHLRCVRAEGVLVISETAANPLTSLTSVKNEELEIIVHQLTRNPANPARPLFVEQTLDFTSLRASIGMVDAAPRSGTFRLKVGAQTTAALTWPADLSTRALIDAWKLQVLAALKALPNVGTSGSTSVSASDPAGAPAHIFSFTWADPARTELIEVAENRLTPPIQAVQLGNLAEAGYTQELKLIQFPLAISSPGAFTRPLPPPAQITQTRAGAAGVNEEQTLIVPSGAAGSLSLTWAGAATVTMDVANLSAPQLEVALNALLAGGATSPGFTVEARTAETDRRLAIGFTGPLAGAAQPLLGVAMHDQLGWPWASGVLDLRAHLAIERALNGAASVGLTFELVINENEYYLLPITVLNSLTGPQTMDDLATSGAVMVVEQTVYVDSGLGDPFAEVAPGLIFTPPAAGSSFTVLHNLGTWQPGVRVHLRTSASPEHWRQLDPTEYNEQAVTASTVSVTFPYSLTTTSTDALWVGNFRIIIVSPDAQLQLYPHQHTWAQVRQSLPGGMTLEAKLAALDAALAIVGGTIALPVASLTGTLAPEQIDLAALAAALAASAAGEAMLEALLADADVLAALVTALLGSATFLTQLAANATFLSALSTSLAGQLTLSMDRITGLTDALANLGRQTVGAGGSAFVSISIPPVRELFPGASVDGALPVPLGRLLPAIHDATVTSVTTTLPGVLASAGNVFSNGTAGALLLPGGEGWKSSTIPPGGFAGSDGRRWYPLTRSGETNSYFPRDHERTLFFFEISAQMLRASSTLELAFSLTLQILASPERVRAQYLLVIEHGTVPSESTPATTALNLANIAWNATPLLTQRLILGETAQTHLLGAKVLRASGGALSAQKVIYGAAAAADSVPASADFALRARLIQFDIENAIANPKGAVSLSLNSGVASIYPSL